MLPDLPQEGAETMIPIRNSCRLIKKELIKSTTTQPIQTNNY